MYHKYKCNVFTFPDVAMCAANKRRKKSDWGIGEKKRSQRAKLELHSLSDKSLIYVPAQVSDYTRSAITDLGGYTVCNLSLSNLWSRSILHIYNEECLFICITWQILGAQWLNQAEKPIEPVLLPGWNCNSLFSACLKKSLRSCQFIQHAAARNLRIIDKRDHITPVLASLLFGLPIQ